MLGALLDRLAGHDDALWPAAAWPALRLSHGLEVGSAGGHGPIRYTVSAYVPSVSVRFTFDPAIGLRGYHEFVVEPVDERHSRLVHTIVARTNGAMVLRWPLAVRWLHEALLEDLLDNAERAATGLVIRPARHGVAVSLLRRHRARKRGRR